MKLGSYLRLIFLSENWSLPGLAFYLKVSVQLSLYLMLDHSAWLSPEVGILLIAGSLVFTLHWFQTSDFLLTEVRN